MAPTDGLGTLQVCVAGHDVINLTFGAVGSDLEESHDVPLDLAQLIPQPHTHVACDLLVAATPSVELTGHVFADNLA